MADIGSKNWRSVRVSVDLAALPQTVDLSPLRAGAVVQIVFGTIWTVFTWNIFSEVRREELFVLLFAVPFSLIGLGLALNGIATLRHKRRATFRSDGVEVEGRRFWGAESWYQPYTAFKGVLHREKVVKTKRSSTTYQIIELLHDDPGKCVLLYVKPTTKLPRERWEGYAKLLKLPALEAGVAGVVERDHGDLDKSLRKLVEEGKVTHAFDPDADAPRGLYVERRDADSLKVVITVGRFPIWFLALFMLAGAAMMAGAFFTDQNPVILFGAGLLFGGLPCFMLVRDRAARREISLDRRELTVTDSLRLNRPSRNGLSLDEIESIAIRRARGNSGWELVIASDRGPIHVGLGLSKKALVWLRDFITAAIATA